MITRKLWILITLAGLGAALWLVLGSWPFSAEPERQAGSETIDAFLAKRATDSEPSKVASDRELLQPSEMPALETRQDWKPAAPPVALKSAWPAIVAELGTPIDPRRWVTIGSLSRTPVPDSVFDEKYPPDAEEGLLLGNRMLLGKEAGRLILERGKTQFDNGDFEEVVLPLEEADDGTPNSMKLSFYIQNTNGQFPRFGLRTQAADPIPGRLLITFMRFEDHPDIYALLDEELYVHKRLERQSQQKAVK